jgi:putative acetyltransferase
MAEEAKVNVRLEDPGDRASIRAVNEAAFETQAEADLVDALREKSDALISLIAEVDERVVGHILFSPVSLAGQPRASLMGLGPVAVLPQHQRRGVGSTLVRRGLELCRKRGCEAVVVLGHAEYYPRFGFVPASRYGITSAYDVPDDVFMVAPLGPASLQGLSGRVTYDEAFGSV